MPKHPHTSLLATADTNSTLCFDLDLNLSHLNRPPFRLYSVQLSNLFTAQGKCVITLQVIQDYLSIFVQNNHKAINRKDKKMKIDIKKLTKSARIPTYGSEYAAGCDLYADVSETDDFAELAIDPHTTVMVHTGIAMAIPTGYVGLIYARSGLASKKGLRPANCVGVIDSDYRGEIMVPLHNDTDSRRRIEHEDRIAQLIIQPVSQVEFNKVDELDDTVRGAGGFGSTGG